MHSQSLVPVHLDMTGDSPEREAAWFSTFSSSRWCAILFEDSILPEVVFVSRLDGCLNLLHSTVAREIASKIAFSVSIGYS